MNANQKNKVNELQNRGASAIEVEPMGADGTMRLSYHMEGQNLSATLTPAGDILPAASRQERHSE